VHYFLGWTSKLVRVRGKQVVYQAREISLFSCHSKSLSP
jgi:hypothetical protein